VAQRQENWPFPGYRYFVDAAAIGAYVDLPRSLDMAASVTDSGGKDAEGYALMMKMCKPKLATKTQIKKGIIVDPKEAHTPENIARLALYCNQDVRVERDVLAKCGGMTTYEKAIWQTDWKVNLRGVRVDQRFVANAVAILEMHVEKRMARLEHLTGCSSVRTHKFLQWLTDRGIEMEMSEKGNPILDKEAVDLIFDDLDPEHPAYEVLQLRRELNRSSVSKYKAIERCVCADGRLHGMFLYYGAHTGRWSGKHVQLQNLPRGKFEEGTDGYAHARQLVLDGNYEELDFYYDTMEAMSGLIRAALVPSPANHLLVADYASIEGRVLAWLAGEDRIIEAYIGGLDMYKLNAVGVFKVKYEDVDKGQRQIGKVIELACGYQGAVGAFQSMAKNYKLRLPDEEVDAIVKKWRESRDKTVKFWYACEDAAIKATENPGKMYVVGHIAFKKKGGHLLMRLPSGRCLYYRDAFTKKVTKTLPDGRTFTKNTLFYWGVDSVTGRWSKQHTYGGCIAENATQAIARDIEAEALVLTENAGLHPVIHTHDEIATDDPDPLDFKKLKQIMEDIPAWASGIPVVAEGSAMDYYRK
jgi:DNA polymerase